MKKPLLFYKVKFWVLVVGAGLALCGPTRGWAQLSYWSQVGNAIPLLTSSGAGGMIYSNGLLYVPFIDFSTNNIILFVWNGASWISDTVPNSIKDSIPHFYDWIELAQSPCVDNYGNVYIGGTYDPDTADGQSNFVLKWDGSDWSALGANALSYMGGDITSISYDNINNYLYVGIYSVTPLVAKWDGNNWSQVGELSTLSVETSVLTFGGNVYATETISQHGYAPYGYDLNNIAKWNGGPGWD